MAELKISILPRRRIRKSQLPPQPVYVKAGSTAGKNRKNKCQRQSAGLKQIQIE